MSVEKFSGSFSKEESGVTVIPTKTIQQINDFATLGLYCYLLSKPETWRIHYKEIMNHFTCSKKIAYKLLNNLIDLGFLKRQTIREKGRFKEYNYTLYLHSYSTISPKTGNGFGGNIYNIEENKLNNISEASASPVTPKLQKNINQLETQVIEEYHSIFPECPKIHVVDARLQNAIKAMIRDWSKYSGGFQFSMDGFRGFMFYVKEKLPWFFEPYKTASGNIRRNSLRTLVRPTNLAKIRNNEFTTT
jgi:hypothetical protein